MSYPYPDFEIHTTNYIHTAIYNPWEIISEIKEPLSAPRYLSRRLQELDEQREAMEQLQQQRLRRANRGQGWMDIAMEPQAPPVPQAPRAPPVPRAPPAPQAPPAFVPKEDVKTDDKPCLVCLENEKHVLYKPCNHVACCSSCTVKLLGTTRKCPICRGNITSAECIFLS